jgi:peroxiredoxin Q/BCP
VVYFTASCDTPEVNKKFAESLELDYPILSDPEGEVARKFGVLQGKSKFPARWTFYIGKDGRIMHIDKQVNVAKHAVDVAERLEALQVAKRPVPDAKQ